MKKLSYANLISSGTLLGYRLKKGMCRGLVMMWAQAIFADDEASFFQRFDLIADYQSDFTVLQQDLKEAQHQVKNHQTLGSHAEKLLDLFAFFDGVELYLHPKNYADCFPRKGTDQDSIDLIYERVKPQSLVESHLHVLLKKNYIFNKKKLYLYLLDLSSFLKDFPLELPIVLGGHCHCVGLKYNKFDDYWSYLDPNDFDRYPESVSYSRKLQTEELVNSIFQSFWQSSTVMIRTILLTNTRQNIHYIEPQIKQLKLAYPIKPQHTRLSNAEGSSLLHMACWSECHREIKTLLRMPQNNINHFDCEGNSGLSLLCIRNHIPGLKTFLKQKHLHLNQANFLGKTPLYLAAERDHVAIVEILLKRININVNQGDIKGKTPLIIACEMGHAATIERLLGHVNLAWNQSDIYGRTALFSACQKQNLGIVKQLLAKKKTNVNVVDINRMTALHILCELHGENTKELCDLLLKNHADLTYKNDNNQTALDIAFLKKNNEAILAILSHSCTKKLNPSSLIVSTSLETLIDWTSKKDSSICDYLNHYANAKKDKYTVNTYRVGFFIYTKIYKPKNVATCRSLQ